MAVFGLAMLSKILSFNGLYGQDAHEYLRQSRVLFDRMHGLPAPVPGFGEAEFGGGYPLAAALLHFLIPDAVLAMQMVSWLSAGLAVWFFIQNLQLLTPGARMESRAVFAALALAMAPYFVRSGLSSMSDALGLALALGALWFGLRVVYKGRSMDAMAAAILMAWAVTTRFGLGALLFPLAGAILLILVRNRNFWGIAGMSVAGLLAFLPHFWLKNGVEVSVDRHWSLLYFFQNSFSNENGSVHNLLPNILYLLYPLAHPGFCLLLPGLLLLAKKTDLILPSKKVVIACIACYLLLLGGIPHQNMRYLLPAYAFLLLLFFPAWDRMYAYGFYFFKRLTWSVLVAVLVVQIIVTVKILASTLTRNQMEVETAAAIQSVLPPRATVYAFDLDVAMRSYLPEMQWKNMWTERYDSFPAGSYVLFNEPLLRPQWEGKTPMLNWDNMNRQRQLVLKKELPGGWKVFLIMMNDE